MKNLLVIVAAAVALLVVTTPPTAQPPLKCWQYTFPTKSTPLVWCVDRDKVPS